MATVKTTMLLDTRKLKKDNNYPVKLRVTFERKQKYYPTTHNLTKLEFERAMYGKNKTEKEKTLNAKIVAYENKALEVIEKLAFFTWQAFEKQYYTNRGAKDTINLAFEERIKVLKEAGQIGTAVSYQCSKKSLDLFSPNAKFSDITPELLSNYEKYMLTKGNSKTTVSMYLRCLRSLFNSAISNNDILPALYPFRRNEYEKNKYEIPEGSNIKKALDMADIKKVFTYKTLKGSVKDMAKDYWIFIYLTSGLNVKDLCLLQYEKIEGERLKFIRAKTAKQKKEKIIEAVLQPEALAIIKKWGNKMKDGKTFIFPVLSGKETPERQRQLIQQLTHVINDNMKAIADDLNITKGLTTYVARHSFATVLKRSGASMELISEMLGHSNLKTTKNYLASFESETLKETTKALTAFKKQKKVKSIVE
jgi:site-specific recombinase XerD